MESALRKTSMTYCIAALLCIISLANGAVSDVRKAGDQCLVNEQQRSEGREFVLMFMENRVDDPQNFPLEVYVTPGATVPDGREVAVTVSAPQLVATSKASSTQHLSVTPGEVKKVLLDYRLRMYGTRVSRKCVRVNGTENLVVYAVNKETFTNDGFLGISTEGLGTRYFTVMQYPPTYLCEFGVAGVHPGTVVNITLPASDITNGKPRRPTHVNFNGKVYRNGESFQVKLDYCSTLQVQSEGDLTGTLVEANKPIAVFSGNARTNVGVFDYAGKTRDHLVEQMPPVDAWAREFIACPTPGRTIGDVYYILASKANTQVLISGERVSKEGAKTPYQRKITLFKAGAYKRLELPSDLYSAFVSNNGILVVKIVASQEDDKSSEKADPAMAIIPPTEQYDSKYAFSTTAYAGKGSQKYTHHLTIMALKRAGMMLDGNPMEQDIKWHTVPNTKYSCGYTTVTGGSHDIRQTLPSSSSPGELEPFGAILYGAGDRESYSYPIGMKLTKINTVCQRCTMIPCDAADNDCDGTTNEELCDGIDNDNDGLIDEDCCGEPVQPKVAVLPLRCFGARNTTSCFGSTAEMKCPTGEEIVVVKAHFGRVGHSGDMTCENDGGSIFGAGPSESQCGQYRDVYQNIAPLCNGKTECQLRVDSKLLDSAVYGAENLCDKYLDVSYLCKRSGPKTCKSLASVTHSTVNTGLNMYTASSYATQFQSCPAFKQQKSAGGDCIRPGYCGSGAVSSAAADSCHPRWAVMAADNLHGWCPSKCDTLNSFLEIDLGNIYDVDGVLVQGCRKHQNWVTSFTMKSSLDREEWLDVTEGDPVAKKFSGNRDSIGVNHCELRRLEARYLRIYVQDYHKHPCLHAEVLRCTQPKSY